jgi:hypothetical protein
VPNRPEEEADEEATWMACAEWSNFEPVPGHPKKHPELLYFPETSTHLFEGSDLTDFSEISLYQDASPHRKALIEELCMGCRKFEGEVSAAPRCDAPLSRYPGYAQVAAISRTYQIADGADYRSMSDPSPDPPAQSPAQAPATSPAPRPPGVPKQWSLGVKPLSGGQE